MNKEKYNNSRSGFLKNLSVAFVSIFGFGIAGLSFHKLQRFLGASFKSISVSEANNHISNIHFSGMKQIKPESAPKSQQTIDRLKTNEI
ncbi:MAG: hypothetical protein PF485_10415 [Bacteroidales bacterium]|jgi:hypothetical protein|nr:hypothetical protein [Bacteroidales bacterium]